MWSWTVRVTLFWALICEAGCPMLSSRLQANCKLDGIWKDPRNRDYIFAEYIPKERSSKPYSEIFITYMVYNGRFKGSGIYNGMNTAAFPTLSRNGLGKDLQGFMTCHNGRLYIEGLHPYEPSALKVYDKASLLTRPSKESVGGFPETEREEGNSDEIQGETQPDIGNQLSTAAFAFEICNDICMCTCPNVDGGNCTID